MPDSKTASSSKQKSPLAALGQLVLRVFAVLILIGLVLGAWRYLGQGVGIGSPGWLTNAFDSVTHFMRWGQTTSKQVIDHSTTTTGTSGSSTHTSGHTAPPSR